MNYRNGLFTIGLLAATGCVSTVLPVSAFEITGTSGTTLTATEVAAFDGPWAMTFLPDGTSLVTEKSGKLFHLNADGNKTEIGGVPEVAFAGQGGLGDVITHPDFASNNEIFLSYAESGDSGNGAVVIRATLDLANNQLTDIRRIWEQTPKVSGAGHYSHKMAISPDGKLFISSGDRQKLDPAQDMNSDLGKLIRLNLDGTIPADNPYQDQGERAKTFWSVGHRNMLGIDFAADGKLWTHEMGPRHGDELNLIEAGTNYGWPLVSNGDHYSGRPIPDHDTDASFNAPEAYWIPSIAPSGLEIYEGDLFADWRGDALIGGLVGQALIRVDIDGTSAREAERFEWGSRVREVELGPDGAIYVLEDGDGRLLKLVPAG